MTIQYYAGVGSCETPMPIMDQMAMLAGMLARKGWGLRSGGAKGADTAFECGAVNGGAYHMDRTIETFSGDRFDSRQRPQWFTIAEMFHPAWHNCDERARLLHARNTPIMLGAECNVPVKFVACWTPDGAVTGGTGQALRIAAAYGIPVFNMALPEHLAALWKYAAGA